MRLPKIALIILASAIFGSLMGARELVDGIWARSLIAGVAGGFFAVAIGSIQSRGVKK